MTPREFVIWFQGFVKAANTYNITPKQWDFLCEELDKVKIEEEKETHTVKYNIENSNSTY